MQTFLVTLNLINDSAKYPGRFGYFHGTLEKIAGMVFHSFVWTSELMYNEW